MERLSDINNSIARRTRGLSFARAAIAIALGKGSAEAALEFATTRYRYSPHALAHVKAAVSAGTTADANWALPLAYPDQASSEFAQLLSEGTIAGRMALRRVPANIRYPRQTGGAAVGWVQEGGASPFGSIPFATNTIGIAKAAGIVALTKELLMHATLDAELLVRDELLRAVIQFLDEQFVSPSVAAVANQNPASITNGLTPTQSSGSTALLIASDLAAMIATLADANETDALYFIGTRSDQYRLAAKRDTAGGAAFEGMSDSPPTLLGIPYLASNAVPHSVSAGSILVLANAAGIDYADSDSVAVSASQNATLQMDSAPTESSAAPTGTTAVSMFQTNSVALKVVAFRNWARMRSTAVTYLDNFHL